MTVSFKLKLEDLIAVQSFIITRSKFHKRNKLIGSIVAVILLLIVNITVFKANLITTVVVSSGLFFVTYNFIYKKAVINQIERLAKNNPSVVNNECTLTVSENGLLTEFKNSTTNTEWSEIKVVSEDDDRYILYLSEIKTIVIKKKPHDMLEEEIQKFNQLLSDYFNEHNIDIVREEGIKWKKATILITLSTVLGIIFYKSMFPTHTSGAYSGDSETWKVVDVEISADERLNIGEGTLYMKDETKFLADYFKLSFHVVLKNEIDSDSRLHEYELEADNLPVLWDDDVLDIAKMDTGWSSPIFLTMFGRPVTMNNIKQVYIIVQWKGKNDHELQEEKIILTPMDI